MAEHPETADEMIATLQWGDSRFRPRVEPAAGVEMRPGWRLDDARLEADAIAFWERIGNLPAGADPAGRAKELVGGGYAEGRLVAVATAVLTDLAHLRARFALLRVSVDPEARRGHLASTMTYYARNYLERWAEENPLEKVAGLAGLVESPDFRELQREPYWPESGFGVVGYTDEGRQLRVSWFRHFRYD